MNGSQWFNLPPNALALIAEKYDRTEASLLEDVATLKKWMRSQPHLPEILDDKRLQNFLTLNKCSVEKAKQRIDMYYTLRGKIPEIFNNSNVKCEVMKRMEKVMCWVMLPNLTKDLYRVWILKVLDKNGTDKLDPIHIMSQALAMQEIRLKEDVMFGEFLVLDFEGFNFGFISKFTPTVIAKIFAVYGKVLSLPMRQCYIINSPSFIGTLLAVMKGVLKPKIFNRIQVCEDTSILRQVLPKEELPRDYGGDGKSVRELFEMAKIKMRQYHSRYDELDQMKVNESLRPQKLDNDEILGFHGNFKKLDVD